VGFRVGALVNNLPGFLVRLIVGRRDGLLVGFLIKGFLVGCFGRSVGFLVGLLVHAGLLVGSPWGVTIRKMSLFLCFVGFLVPIGLIDCFFV